MKIDSNVMKYICFLFSFHSTWLVRGFTTTSTRTLGAFVQKNPTHYDGSTRSKTTTTSTSSSSSSISTKTRTGGETYSSTTKLYLENWVANLIDEEYYRLNHKDEFETEWMKKNKQAVMQSLNHNNNNNLLSTINPFGENVQQLIRDQRLAKKDPQRYCADRCIATGNCDVYEDM